MTYYQDSRSAGHTGEFITLAVAEDASVAVGELMQALPAQTSPRPLFDT